MAKKFGVCVKNFFSFYLLNYILQLAEICETNEPAAGPSKPLDIDDILSSTTGLVDLDDDDKLFSTVFGPGSQQKKAKSGTPPLMSVCKFNKAIFYIFHLI